MNEGLRERLIGKWSKGLGEAVFKLSSPRIKWDGLRAGGFRKPEGSIELKNFDETGWSAHYILYHFGIEPSCVIEVSYKKLKNDIHFFVLQTSRMFAPEWIAFDSDKKEIGKDEFENLEELCEIIRVLEKE